jgi:hypothetical protein
LEVGLPREVLVRVTEEGEYKEVTKTYSGEELRAFPARRRSVSPKKRKALSGEESQLYSAITTAKRKAIEDQTETCEGVKTKRRRVSDDSFDIETQWTTPEMYNDLGILVPADLEASNAATSHSTSQPSPPSDPLDSPRLIVANRFKWIQSRQPSNPDLYCCHCASAKASAKTGLPGKPELDGRYLCFKCLGVEYVDADTVQIS